MEQPFERTKALAVAILVIGLLQILAGVFMWAGPSFLSIYAGAAVSGGFFSLIMAAIVHRLSGILMELRQINAREDRAIEVGRVPVSSNLE